MRCNHNIYKMDKPTLLQIGTTGQRGKETKRSQLWARRSLVAPKLDFGSLSEPFFSSSSVE